MAGEIEMNKLKLKITKFAKKHGYPWSSCAPFVDNSRALLIHRPAQVTTFKATWGTHTGVHYWCGGMATGNVFTFLDTLDGEKLVCARCEENATSQGLPSSDELIGRHVHKGKVIAVKTCCDTENSK